MLDEKKFKQLFERKGKHLISIFIPTYRANHNQEDRLRLKNALKEAANQLKERGMNSKDAVSHLSKGYELVDNERFFSNLSDGLCLFIDEDYFHYETLPVNFNPYVYTGDHFYLRPVLPVLTGQSRFFLLALSQNEVRFFEGHQHSIIPVKIDDLVPESMKEIFEMSDVKEYLQHHSGQGASRGKQGGREAMYHGQGYGKDDQVDDLKKYFKEIDSGLMKMLHDEHPPMIIAAVDYLVPVYSEVSSYSNLLKQNISGNPEELGPAELHEKGWQIISQYYKEQQESNRSSFQEAMAQNKATADINQIVPAAVNGRVDTLYVNKDYHTYGSFDEQQNAIIIHEERQPDSEELLGMAAVQTYLQSGHVELLERSEMPMPTANLNAVLRY